MTYEMTHRKLKKPMNNTFPPARGKQLTGFYAALVRHCEAEIRQMRSAFQMELGRLKNPGAQAAYRGNHTVDTCWQALATDDFIRVVRDLSDLCGRQIGAVPLLLENRIPPPKQRRCR